MCSLSSRRSRRETTFRRRRGYIASARRMPCRCGSSPPTGPWTTGSTRSSPARRQTSPNFLAERKRLMETLVEYRGDLDDIKNEMRRFLGADTSALDEMTLQEVLTYASKRASAEGYDFEVSKVGDKPLSAADQRREDARAKLRGDLEASIKAEETAKQEVKAVEEPAPEEPK